MSKIILDSHPHPKYPRLQLQLRSNSRFYQAVTRLDGKKQMVSTKTLQLTTAFKLGEEWYKKLCRASVDVGRQHPLDRFATDPTLAELFASYRKTLPLSKRQYADMKWGPMAPFWKSKIVTEIAPQTFRDFYKWRRRFKTRSGESVSNHTLHKDMMVIRQTLKYAIEETHIVALPIIPKPGKIAPNPRPWLDPDEWVHLLAVSEKRIAEAKGNPKLFHQRSDLHDFIRFMYRTMMRVNEVRTLRVGQCRIMADADPPYVAIDVHGKRGHRTAIGHAEAGGIVVLRWDGKKPDDLLFPIGRRDGFRELLTAAGLLRDAFGNQRNLKSLRHTSISHYILNNPAVSLIKVARNAGTSVQMLDLFYCRRLTAEMAAGDLAQ